MFVRVKKISGKEYAYAVENTWKNGSSKQKVKKYLGPVVRLEKIDVPVFAEWKDVDLENYFDNTPLRTICKDLIRHLLASYGFEGRTNGDVTVDLNGSVLRRKKECVVPMNEGFLYHDTIRALLNVKPAEEETRGQKLAEILVKAGLKVDKEVFVLLYRKIHNI